MSQATHVRGAATWRDGRLHLNDPMLFNAGMRRLTPGDGEQFVVRAEREAEAKKYHRLKWYYGYIVKQCVEKTGYPVPEMDTMFRALFMPADVETLSLMLDDQMRDFNLQCEQYAAEVIGVVVQGPRDAREWAA